MGRHPYRDPEIGPAPPSPATRLPADDLALALIVGVLGILLGITAERPAQLCFGLLVVALAVLVVAAARRAGRG